MLPDCRNSVPSSRHRHSPIALRCNLRYRIQFLECSSSGRTTSLDYQLMLRWSKYIQWTMGKNWGNQVSWKCRAPMWNHLHKLKNKNLKFEIIRLKSIIWNYIAIEGNMWPGIRRPIAIDLPNANKELSPDWWLELERDWGNKCRLQVHLNHHRRAHERNLKCSLGSVASPADWSAYPYEDPCE